MARVRWRWRGRRGTLVTQLQLAGEAHGDGKVLRVVDLGVEAGGGGAANRR
jgi:hypothetical protein